MTILETEDTTIHNNCDDATQMVDCSSSSPKGQVKMDNNDTTTQSEEYINKHKKIKFLGGITAGGVLLGTAASIYKDIKGDSTTEFQESGGETEEDYSANEGIILPEITVEALKLVTEEQGYEGMTFEEAFSAARQEMGPGSAFEWHGNAYATYTKEEWAEMSNDQKSDFYDTLHIANPFSSYEAVEVLQADVPGQTGDAMYAATDLKPDETVNIQSFSHQEEEDTYGEDIPIVSVENASENEDDIQILGVEQDISTGYNIGHLRVDGEEVVVIDVDGDMVFDSMVADINHDGDITPDEIIDISEQSLSLNDFPGNADIYNSLASGDTPNYLSEITE